MQQWAYTSFIQLQSGKNYHLYLDKVGTIADIYLNGNLIESIDSIYRTYYVSLPQQSVTGYYNLTIEIKSTVRETYIRASNYTQDVISVETPWENIWVSPSWIQDARSQQIDFGWDWSLAMAPQGLYGKIELYEDLEYVLQNPLFIQDDLYNPIVYAQVRNIGQRQQS